MDGPLWKYEKTLSYFSKTEEIFITALDAQTTQGAQTAEPAQIA